MGKVEQVSKEILAHLLNDFQERDLNADPPRELRRDFYERPQTEVF